MDDVYEVDNRYPEVAEPYEKVRGGRHYGRVGGARELAAVRRAGRSSRLRRGFWTAATAAVTALVVLLASPGWSSRAAASGSFEEPAIKILTAVQSDTATDEIEYSYRVEMNGAESVELTVAARTEAGESLGEAGPFCHTQTGNYGPQTLRLSRTEALTRVELELSLRYVYGGEEREAGTSCQVELRSTPPETGTEAPPETVTAEPETEAVPTETEVFTAPTIQITEAELDGPAAGALRYGYRVELNSAEQIRVQAELTADNGASLGVEGPYTYQSSTDVPVHSAVLTWTERPSAVTLTLTGTYTEHGEEKTVTVTKTLSVSKPGFTAPTLDIADTVLMETDVMMLSYRYEFTLNSAERIQVSAAISSEAGVRLGTDGPYTHTASGTSSTHNARLSWTSRPSAVILTLTGSYMENGEQKTVTASKTLTVPDPPFEAPRLSIAGASLNGVSVTPLSYSYQVTLNSAKEMQVSAVVTANDGTRLNTDGPYTHTASGTSPTHSVRLSWSSRPSTVTLTLTGTYTENGVQKTVTASKLLDVSPEVFDPPEITISSAVIDDMNSSVVVYSFGILLHENSNPASVTVSVTDADGQSYGSAGPFTFTSSGTRYEQVLRCSSTLDENMTLVVTASYQINGVTKTVTARRDLEEATPFEWPEIQLLDVGFVAGSVSEVRYSYFITFNSVSLLRVKAQFLDREGNLVYETGYTEHTVSDDGGSNTCEPGRDAVSIRLLGEFDHLGITYTIRDSDEITRSVADLPERVRPKDQIEGHNHETVR